MKKTLLLLLIILSCFHTKAQCWKTIAAGSEHTIAIRTDGTLWTWGFNGNGELGDGTWTSRNVAKKIGTDKDWKTLSTSFNHTVAQKADGTIWAWGYNYHGQLGDGTNSSTNIPTQIGTANNWQTIATGNHHTVAIKKDGTLWAWGGNYNGELGDGTTIAKNSPTQIGTSNDWQTITAGFSCTMALKKDGTLWAWGDNSSWQLADGTTTNSSVPKQIGTATDWKTIALGTGHTIALKTDGTLWAWGRNPNGALGDGTSTNRTVPTQIGTSTDWKTIAVGTEHSIALKTNGSLWTWGRNFYGQLGNGTTAESLVPIQIGTNTWQTAVAGSYQTIALNMDNSILTWGRNSYGQLGNGTSTDKKVPTVIDCPGAFTLTGNTTNVTCIGDADGSASISVSGGTTPYSYVWSNGATTEKITGMPAGTYSCTVTDASSLSITKSFDITEPVALIATTTITNIDCNSNNNGIITITATGGTMPYQYGISISVFQSSNVFTGLSAGSYELYVKDNNGCISSNYINILANNTPPPTATAQIFNAGATVNSLQATGSNIQWYNAIIDGIVLDVSAALQTGKYYVSQTINGCESSRTAVDVTVTPVSANEQIPTDGLLAYYPFTGNANDTSGKGNNGIATDVTLTEDRFGKSNSAYSFNGTSSHIESSIANYPLKGGSRTITGWFKADVPTVSNESDFCLLNYGNISDPNYWFKMSLYSKGYLDIQFDSKTFQSQENYFNNEWTFFAMTFDEKNNTYSLYINGVYKMGGAASLYTNGFNNFFRIGRNKLNNYFEGAIDDIGIWNRVLTQDEIAGLYNSENNNLYTLIPDVNFENKLIALGIDSGATDGKVLTSNIDKLTSLDVSSSSITSLTGIEYFVNLETLNCDSNNLETLDVSKNLNLKKIDCNYNEIKTLDVSNNLKLKNLDVSINKLTTLDVTKNIALIDLNCGNNQLTALNISKNVNLGRLRSPNNELETLDVSNNVALDTLVSYSNKLSRLDISKNIILKELNCSGNKLIFLNLKNGNNLNFIKHKLFFTSNPNLTCILVDDKIYSDTNWTNSKDVSATYNTDCIQYTLIPDPFFEQKLIDLGIDTDGLNGKISNTEANSVNTLDLSESSISDLTGIVAFKSLSVLNCAKNKLTNLDLSDNNSLIKLDCSDNQLTSLNLKNGNNLNFIIQNLKFTNNPNLNCILVDDKTYSDTNWTNSKDATATYNTDCATTNQYTYIPDINFEKKLIALGIDSGVPDGKVPTADVASLTSLDVSQSNISNLTGIEDFISLTKLDCNNNKLLTLDISNNKLLKELTCSFNKLTVLDLSANSGLTVLECHYNQIAILDVSNMLELQGLLCSGNKITNLDVTKNLALYWFGCSSNKITALDVSQNKLLQYLDCGNNQLTSLDVSNNTALFDLNCYNNKLTSIDVSMLTGLKSLACSANQLSSLNISKNAILNSLMCENLTISTLDVSNNTALTELYCGNGQLTALDVSKNKELTILSCQNNLLTNLNIKNGTNTQLTDVGFIQNPNLTCIQVDDVIYSNTNWADKKDVTATYSEYCDYYTLIPDSNFEQKLIDLGIDTDGLNGKITITDVSTITTLDLSNSNIKDLSGIEIFTALNILDCSNNQLVSLDLSKNTNLQILYVTGNPLVYLNLRNGNNQNLIVASVTGKKVNNIPGTSFLGITSLGCVKVDNADYSNANWSKIKETTTVYSETCTLGLEDSEFNKAIVYPNPTKGEVNILNIAVEKASVYNALGQLVKTFNLDAANTNNTINLSGLPKGVYYLYLINQDAASAKKIIVE